MTKRCALLALLAASSPLLAQTLPGHSMHGEAFNEGPRQAAYLMQGTGRVTFPATTSKPEAQRFITQGVGQLHGFWYFEAERSFRQAAAIDPDCAMAYWGMAMANVNNEARAKGFIEKAEALLAKASAREGRWIKLLGDYYRIPAGEGERRARAYVKGLEAILFDFPDDVEAKAFLVWTLWHHRDKGLPIGSHQAVDALIADVLRANPRHPGAHHYRIHLWDQEKPERALESAALYGPSSPGIAHAWHMPGHIYAKLHRYAEAARQQEASARVDHAHMAQSGVMPYQIHNYAHNNQWLVEDLSHVGRVREAVAVAENLIAIPRHPKLNRLEDGGSAARSGRHRLMQTLAEWELWDALAERADTTLASADAREDRLQRARVLGAAFAWRGGDRARRLIEELQKTADAEEEKKRKPILAAIEEIEGRLALAAGNPAEAIERFKKAESSKALLAQAHHEAGRPEEALKLSEEALKEAPGQLAPLARHAALLVRLGRTEPALEACRRLMALAGEADEELPVLRRLAPFLKEHGLTPAAPAAPAMDLGALGPPLWSPPPAPEGLPRERPLLALFFLGSGCSHCVAQLGAFQAAAGDFRAAGIKIAAISTEAAGGPGDVSFEVRPDPTLALFKAFGCTDDFEKAPLHGTFLIDEEGRIRWGEISFTPFMEAAFLLEESRRLLSLRP